MSHDLVGWKAIAEYMGVCHRTARRWAYKMGMPVYKLGGVMVAAKYELDTWRVANARPVKG